VDPQLVRDTGGCLPRMGRAVGGPRAIVGPRALVRL